jgi:hypothetical protein
MPSAIKLEECLWLQGEYSRNSQPVFRPLERALRERGATLVLLNLNSRAELQKLRDLVWKTDRHVMFLALQPWEFRLLRPVFADRKNFSLIPVDWWLAPFWYSQHATFNIFHTYHGIMVRTGRDPFLNGARPPWLLIPDRPDPYLIQCALLRPAALLASPLLDVYKWFQRSQALSDPKRFLYFPYPIANESVPLQAETPQYDFTNLGAIVGPWLTRDPYAPAWLNFANLYADRRRLIDLILKFEGLPFKVYDRRKNNAWLPWDELNRLIRQSRFMVCTGGLQNSSIPKYLEYACLGIPMIGTALPYEFPWLDECLVSVDPMRITAAELKPRLTEALDRQASLRHNCLAARDSLLKMYDPHTLLDMMQEQIEGQPIRPGYLKGRQR